MDKPNTNHRIRIIFGNLFTYNECPTDTPTRHTDRHTTPTKCHQFDRVAVSRGRSPRILGIPPKFLRPGGPESPFPVLSDKYFCQKRFGKLIVISRLFSRLVLPLVGNAWEVTKRKRPAIQMQYSQKRLVMDFYCLQFF